MAVLVVACAPPGPLAEAPAPQPPSAQCEDYLACLAEVSTDTLLEAYAAYGPDSGCWVDAVAARACDAQCARALEEASASFPQHARCAEDPCVGASQLLRACSAYPTPAYSPELDCGDAVQTCIAGCVNDAYERAGCKAIVDFAENAAYFECLEACVD